MSDAPSPSRRLSHARVLVALGEPYDAETEVGELLDQQPQDLDALSLFAKIKHMRGELSQAVACWAQIHAQARSLQTAQMQLRAVLNMAMDPERGAGEFLVLGQLQLMRKPVAQLELEEAFGLFLRRRPDEARARCEQAARRYQRRDAETYKLAVLAGAWIAELSGDLEAACRMLEQLGQERGFEADIDRVLALERIYERLGGRERIEAAVHICQHVLRHHPKISILARLGALWERLGQTELARDYAQRYQTAFGQRMHRPSFAEVVQVAAQSYLPLMRLASLQLASSALDSDATPRERALASALQGERAAARAQLQASGTVLDQKYVADLAVLEGDLAEAATQYMAALRRSPDDLRVVGWLLEQLKERAPARIADFFREPEMAARTRALLEEAIRAWPLRPSLWRHLATLLDLREETRAEVERCSERASALAEARRRDAHPVGRALAAAAYHFIGKVKGLIHEVWAGREPAPAGLGGSLPVAQILGNLSPDMSQGVQNTFLSVREYARSKFPHLTADILDFTYTYKITKEDEPSYGLSAGLPSALAFLSVFLQRPVPQDVASSGALVADAHDVLTLRPVGDSEHKVKGAYNRNLRALVLPLGNRAELSANVLVPASVQHEIVRYAADLDEAVKLVFGPNVFFETHSRPHTGIGREEVTHAEERS